MSMYNYNLGPSGDPNAGGAPSSYSPSAGYGSFYPGSYDVNGFNLGSNGQSGVTGLAGMLGIDPRGNNVLGDSFRNLSIGYTPSAYSSAAFSSALQPGQQQNLLRMLQQLSPGNQWGNAQAVRTQAMGGANDAAAQTAASLRASGAGIGAGQGAMVGAYNNANRTANDYLSNAWSPQGISATGQAMGSIYGQASQNPSLQNMLGMYGPMEGMHQQNQQEQNQGGLMPILQGLGGLAGTYVHGGGTFGGGGAHPYST